MKRLEFTASRIMPEAFSDAPEGIEVIDSGIRTAAFSAEVLTWSNFAITVVFGIPAGVVANFIYDSIKNRSKEPPETIAINQTCIRFERGKITEFIETKITETQERPKARKPDQK